VSNQNTQQALALPEKEVIQPHLPVRLPCYDFTPVTSPAFGIPLLAVKVMTSGMASSHSVTGGPDSPSMDEPCGGTLRFSGHWILTNVCITHADILASASSTTARAGASL
ncbi:hypothetical protein Tco_0308669, partial [Tanacetum coccineum]